VFTSLFGGSCWQTAERLRRENSHIRHLTGVNLPMLLAFANKRETTELDALLETLSEYGRKGIHP
jgi:mannose/fructose-specific phosphotransferase system component IIA